MFLLKTLKSVIVMFQTDISPNQIAWGFAFGAILGLVPNMFMKLILFVVIMLFRVNITAALIGCSLYAIISYPVDFLFDSIGYAVLNISFLNSFYTWLYNLPVVPFTDFNNTIVMGSMVVGLILLVPNEIFVKKFLVYYRTYLKDKISKWKIVKVMSSSILVTKIINLVK